MELVLASNAKVAETSSKGNQEKWLDGNRWYKLDQFGYEALAETFTSELLAYSNITTDTPFSFVKYRMEKVQVHGRQRTACSSESFLPDNTAIITVAQLLKKELGKPAAEVLGSLSSDKKRLQFLAEKTAEITGLSMFPQYLTLLFEIDSLVLNDDRHLNNIAVLECNGSYDYCPIFDQGAGLLSDTVSAPMDIAPTAVISTVVARPLQTTFNRQIKTMRALYGQQLQMPLFGRNELTKMLYPLLPYYAERDRGLIQERVLMTILTRQKQMG